jgi:hypothetical protein
VSNPSKSATADPVRTAVRFPLHLPVSIQWAKGEFEAVTEDVSANGILFVADDPPPVDARVEFNLTMPGKIMGTTEDLKLHCIGRIVRHQQTGGKKMAAAVIDEYSLKAEQT